MSCRSKMNVSSVPRDSDILNIAKKRKKSKGVSSSYTIPVQLLPGQYASVTNPMLGMADILRDK